VKQHSRQTLPVRLCAVVVATAVAALLSGCGIRDTSLPVDAGVGASRTACPPSPGASLSNLGREGYPSPAAGWALNGPAASTAPEDVPTPTATPLSSGTPSCLQPATPAGAPPTPTGVPTPTP
jgi:hypothetical protein